MSHIHAREHLERGAAVRVDCDHQCNVLVMDDHNYRRYRDGESFQYHGGFYRRMPALVRVPIAGFWNVVLDLAGRAASIRYNISFRY